jgi:hypothetical protein
MKTIDLRLVSHSISRGDRIREIEPNIREDCLLVEDGKAIGFFLLRVPRSISKLVRIADHELMSDRVPKQNMQRKVRIGSTEDGKTIYEVVSQYSCIIGTVPPKKHMRRYYTTRSSVHGHVSARPFVKSMLLIGRECLNLIRKITPDIYASHMEAVTSSVPREWLFAGGFTSSISNVNGAAPLHRDNYNVKGAVNAIVCTRYNASGGNLHVPDYNATFDQRHLSLLVYPAWKNAHAVTPIRPTMDGGYRNTLVFYALDVTRQTKNFIKGGGMNGHQKKS